MKKTFPFFLGLFALMLLLVPQADAFSLTSSAFSDGSKMPHNSGYARGNVSPALMWQDFPEKTLSFALVMEDPDARGWAHWLVYNIPVSSGGLRANFPNEAELADGTRQGLNDFKKIGYGGPRPPSGTHRYVFRLFALDKVLDLKPGSSKSSLLEAMNGHILAETDLTGTYNR